MKTNKIEIKVLRGTTTKRIHLHLEAIKKIQKYTNNNIITKLNILGYISKSFWKKLIFHKIKFKTEFQ